MQVTLFLSDCDPGGRRGRRSRDGPLRRGRPIRGPHRQRGRDSVQGDPVPAEVSTGGVTAASPVRRA